MHNYYSVWRRQKFVYLCTIIMQCEDDRSSSNYALLLFSVNTTEVCPLCTFIIQCKDDSSSSIYALLLFSVKTTEVLQYMHYYYSVWRLQKFGLLCTIVIYCEDDRSSSIFEIVQYYNSVWRRQKFIHLCSIIIWCEDDRVCPFMHYYYLVWRRQKFSSKKWQTFITSSGSVSAITWAKLSTYLLLDV
jgi:hypothetical protein